MSPSTCNAEVTTGCPAFYEPTNVTLWLAMAVLCVIGLLVLGTRGRAIVPSRIQSVAELAYGFIHKMVEDVAGKDGLKYFPYIMTLFIFIVFSNFLGLLPMSFTTTSHLAVTATMALAVFFFVPPSWKVLPTSVWCGTTLAACTQPSHCSPYPVVMAFAASSVTPATRPLRAAAGCSHGKWRSL
jgi:hypothetical protein